MKDIYPMWRLCFLFRMNETSWMKDHHKKEFLKTNPNANEEEIKLAILKGLLSGVNPGKDKEQVLISYLHFSNPDRRIGDDGRILSLNVVSDPTTFPLVERAVSILNSCIDKGYIRQNDEEKGIIYLTEKGRTFVSGPYLIFIKKGNVQLINEFINYLGELRIILLSIIGTIISLNWGTAADFFVELPPPIIGISVLLVILYLVRK